MRSVVIPFVDLISQYDEEGSAADAAIAGVLARGDYVGGSAVPSLERAVSDYLDIPHVVAVNSGTDALVLAMFGLGIGRGDEVITPPNSFIASTASIVHLGATPVFADVLPDQNINPDAIRAAITPRTRAIMPVHLTGRVAEMDAIMDIAREHELAVIEDAAQAFGSRYHGVWSGCIGTVGCFSTHPLKNLNGSGDGGLIVTRDGAMAERLRRFANHGLADRNTSVEFGVVSRMDTLQAALLCMRLPRLADVITRRRANAARYREGLVGTGAFVPSDRPNTVDTHHTMVIQVAGRDALAERLRSEGIGHAIHYPRPIHLQPAARHLGHREGSFPVAEAQAQKIISLPIHQFLGPADIDRVVAVVRDHCAEAREEMLA